MNRALAALALLFVLFDGVHPARAQDKNASDEKPALDPKLRLTAEPVAKLAGRKKGENGLHSAQQIELNVAFDFDKLAGAKGLTGHVLMVNRNGQNASAKLLDDNVFQSQEMYGGTHHAVVHLVQAYLQQKLADGTFDLAAGRLPAGEAFATSPLYCKFMNTGLCGYPYGVAVKLGFSVFPNSTWGARAIYSPSKAFSVRAGAYQIRPEEGGKYGFDWGWSGTKGAYLPAEVAWTPTIGDGLPGHYKVGIGYETARYSDNFRDVNGSPFVLTGLPARMHKGRLTLFLLADQMLERHGEGDTNGLVAFAGLTRSTPSNSQFSYSLFAGLIDQGIIPSRPDDDAGIGITYAKVSPSAVRTQRLQAARDAPLLFGAHGVQSHEMMVEARYAFAIGKHFRVMPDLQYVIRPGATSAQRSGLLGAVRLDANF